MSQPNRRAFLAAAGLATAGIMVGPTLAQPPRGRRPGGGRGRPPRQDNIKQGDDAPDFNLKTLDGKAQVKLSSFAGQRPVALVFGSYT